MWRRVSRSQRAGLSPRPQQAGVCSMSQQGLQCHHKPIRRSWHSDPGLQQQGINIWVPYGRQTNHLQPYNISLARPGSAEPKGLSGLLRRIHCFFCLCAQQLCRCLQLAERPSAEPRDTPPDCSLLLGASRPATDKLRACAMSTVRAAQAGPYLKVRQLCSTSHRGTTQLGEFIASPLHYAEAGVLCLMLLAAPTWLVSPYIRHQQLFPAFESARAESCSVGPLWPSRPASSGRAAGPRPSVSASVKSGRQQ